MKYLLSLVLIIILSGCSKVPECSDEDIKPTLNEIYKEVIEKYKSNPMSAMFTKLATLPNSIVDLKMARATSYDKEISLRNCKATAIFDDGKEAEISYTIQYLNDKEGIYMELDTDFLGEFLQQSLMDSILKIE